MDYVGRNIRLQAALAGPASTRVDAMLITHLPNVRYLTGFTGSNGVLALHFGGTKPKGCLFSDSRYTEQARMETQFATTRTAVGPPVPAALKWLRKQPGVRRVGVESERMTVSAHAVLASEKGRGPSRIGLVPCGAVVEALRMVKEPEEISRLTAAVQLASKAFGRSLKVLAAGVSEIRVAAELEYQARLLGAEGMSFETIVASGARSALPHGVATSQAIQNNGFVIIDFGVILAGYCSDMTRTVYVGKVTAKARKVYQAVLEAQLGAIDQIAPGVPAGKVDSTARKVLEKAGYAQYFTHSTGHGVGLEIHEPPRLGKRQRQQLQPGMVVTVEPGVYQPGVGGVRIEDMVLVTETGHRVLTPTSKEFISIYRD